MNLQEIILDIMYHKLIYLYDDIKDIYYILIFMFITYSTNIIVNISNTDMKLNHKIVIYEAKMKRMAGGTTIYI